MTFLPSIDTQTSLDALKTHLNNCFEKFNGNKLKPSNENKLVAFFMKERNYETLQSQFDDSPLMFDALSSLPFMSNIYDLEEELYDVSIPMLTFTAKTTNNADKDLGLPSKLPVILHLAITYKVDENGKGTIRSYPLLEIPQIQVMDEAVVRTMSEMENDDREDPQVNSSNIWNDQYLFFTGLTFSNPRAHPDVEDFLKEFDGSSGIEEWTPFYTMNKLSDIYLRLICQTYQRKGFDVEHRDIRCEVPGADYAVDRLVMLRELTFNK
jgi:hypothetical protein